MALFPRIGKRRLRGKNLKSTLLDEEQFAEKVAIHAKKLQEDEERVKKQQRMLAIYAGLSPRQKRKLKAIAERKGVQHEQK